MIEYLLKNEMLYNLPIYLDCHSAKHPDIQGVINNLCISELVHRDESDPEVQRYVNTRTVDLVKVWMNCCRFVICRFSVLWNLPVSVQVPVGSDTVQVNEKLLEIIRPYIAQLRAAGVIDNRDAENVCFLVS
jgi:Fanconi anemia group M protein